MRVRSAILATVSGVALLVGSASVALSIPSLAAVSTDPPGNNGFIKVDDQPLDSIPNNQPHVGCTFRVDFYNYDDGDLFADVNFELQPPTSGAGYTLEVNGNTHVFIGEDPAGGGNDLDASETYTLSFTGMAHLQGYHVKLTIHADGSQGADVKHKVFWVSGCETPPPTTTPPTTTPPPTTSSPTVPVPTDIPAGLTGGQSPPSGGNAGP